METGWHNFQFAWITNNRGALFSAGWLLSQKLILIFFLFLLFVNQPLLINHRGTAHTAHNTHEGRNTTRPQTPKQFCDEIVKLQCKNARAATATAITPETTTPSHWRTPCQGTGPLFKRRPCRSARIQFKIFGYRKSLRGERNQS